MRRTRRRAGSTDSRLIHARLIYDERLGAVLAAMKIVAELSKDGKKISVREVCEKVVGPRP